MTAKVLVVRSQKKNKGPRERFMVVVVVLVLLPAPGPIRNGRAHSPLHGGPCAVATKVHTVVNTLLSVSHGVETLHGVLKKVIRG